MTRDHRLLRYERLHEPLLPVHVYRQRLLRHVILMLGIIGFSLAIGIVGYHVTAGYGWLDSLYNAAMILGGMGPASDIRTVPTAAKWFASFYALYSGIALLTSVGVVFAPILHRILHRFHLEEDAG